MSYSIYIGTPEEMESCREICSFSRNEHANTFNLIKNTDNVYNWVFELENYEEFVNFYPVEIKRLIGQIEQILNRKPLENNALLKCLLLAGREAIAKNLQLICVGEDYG